MVFLINERFLPKLNKANQLFFAERHFECGWRGSSWGEYLKEFVLMTTQTKKFRCTTMHHNVQFFNRMNTCYIYLYCVVIY